ncbi:chlorophyll a/b-binding protein [Lyngbya sp. PCC 8106]|uniref:chlorophyll a/b-binding protein n=1 Tax=Lyngbya sp. (strain PCC 8106) TaxID=313612 RepID=UPI0000EAAA2F|nr:chlorophyll a/b-binding protein [Lyngbya sp. PCC 8106]EAW35879.1 CAB/ELIP/HLIP superfamily protein [Lyngbya sp. PCC 8106]
MSSSTPPSTDSNSPPNSTEAEPGFGWTRYAEKINGRFAMVGFILLLGLEFFTGQDLFTWLGLR